MSAFLVIDDDVDDIVVVTPFHSFDVVAVVVDRLVGWFGVVWDGAVVHGDGNANWGDEDEYNDDSCSLSSHHLFLLFLLFNKIFFIFIYFLLFSDIVFVAVVDGFVVGLVGVRDGAVVGDDGNDNILISRNIRFYRIYFINYWIINIRKINSWINIIY